MKPALLAIDCQEHFRELLEGLLPELNATLDAAHAACIPVVFTQHGHPDPEAEEQTSVLVAWWGAAGSIRYGSQAWQLLPELRRVAYDTVITSKRTYDAFQGTELEETLHGHGVDTVIIAGCMTHFCCETTARSAFTKNFNVLFLEDGNATSSQRHHKASLLNLKDGFATVLSCAEARERLAVLGRGKGGSGRGGARPAPRNVKW